MSAQELPLALLRRDGGTQPRAFINAMTVEEYAEHLGEGISLPPATVFYDGENYWLADGYHRTAAAEKEGWKTYPCEVIQGTVEDARWYSYGVNKDHGLRRTNRDKQAAVEAALKHPKAAEMSTREIAEHCGVSHMTIQRAKEPIYNNVTDSGSRTVKRGSSTYTQNTAKIGKSRAAPEPPALPAPTPEPEPKREPQVLAAPDTPLSLLREALERSALFPGEWIDRVRVLLGE